MQQLKPNQSNQLSPTCSVRPRGSLSSSLMRPSSWQLSYRKPSSSPMLRRLECFRSKDHASMRHLEERHTGWLLREDKTCETKQGLALDCHHARFLKQKAIFLNQVSQLRKLQQCCPVLLNIHLYLMFLLVFLHRNLALCSYLLCSSTDRQSLAWVVEEIGGFVTWKYRRATACWPWHISACRTRSCCHSN